MKEQLHITENSRDNSILVKFNRRDADAFGKIYSDFYDELLYYSISLYRDYTNDPADAVHDVFMKLWQNKEMQFKDFINIKAYLFIAIKNNFITFLSQQKLKQKYTDYSIHSYQNYKVDIIESELLAVVRGVLKMLPEDSAAILSMMLDGMSVEEIATATGRTKRTIYNKKSDALSFLKQKLSREKMFVIYLLLGN